MPDQARPAPRGRRDVIDPRELLDLAYDAIFVRTFAERQIIFWNRGAEQLYGYPASEALGQIPGELLKSRYPVPLDEIERSMAASGRWEGVIEHTAADGRVLTVNSRWALKRDGHGPAAILEINSDVTQEKRAQDQILEYQRREADQLRKDADDLARLEEAKSRLLNLASHELRGPLSVLRGYLSMISDGSISLERVPGFIPVMMAKATQINTLVRQMLEAARLEDSRLQLHRRALDIRPVVQGAVSEILPLATNGQRIVIDQPGEPLVVEVDPDRVQTIVANLLDNAVKYSLGKGDITCTVRQVDGTAEVAVRDHGPGIKPGDLRRLFNRFERIVTSENQHVAGTGLGLYLSRELARLHGGDLTVTSTPGQGSNFALRLPAPH